MAFLPGYGIRVFANELAVSTTVAGVTASHSRQVSEVTTVVDLGARFVPGLKSGTMALRGPSDSAVASGLNAEMNAALGVDNSLLVTAVPDGDAIGKPALFCLADMTDWAIDASVNDAVGFTMGAAADESVDMGWVLHPLGAETVDGNGTSVDRGVVGTPSTGGLAAALHVTAYAGLTSALLKVQHSTDNSVWADLVSFTSVTAVTSQRVSVPNGTTVNRYLRAVTDVTGTGSVTFLMVVAPR